MGSDLFVIGLSWRTAPVALREQLAFPDSDLPEALGELVSSAHIDEALVVSTCNRVEVYGATPRDPGRSSLDAATAAVRSYLSRTHGISAETLSECLYEYGESEAVEHMFRVASALDSLVLGEAQVLGQLKSAYGVATEVGATGPILGRCM
ncbi:MAG: glutamyl-tRNA reductase, partial [Myxococcota bacterium]